MRRRDRPFFSSDARAFRFPVPTVGNVELSQVGIFEQYNLTSDGARVADPDSILLCRAREMALKPRRNQSQERTRRTR